METKTANVKRVVHNTRSYDSKFGKMFIHQIEFENGDKGDYSGKSETCTKFKEGEQAAYTIEPNGNYPPKIKPVNEQQNGGLPIKKTGSNASFALSYAKDLACANIQSGKPITSDDTIKIANTFLEWLNEKNK